MNTAHCAVSDASVFSSRAIANASNSFALQTNWFHILFAKSVTLLATVLADKLRPSNTCIRSGHKISLALTIQSFMNNPSVKGRDDLAIISIMS